MKKEIIGMIGFCLFLSMLILRVEASVSCHKEYYINGTAYINDTCVLDDEELEEDVYGSETGSGSEDIILRDIERRLSNSSDSNNVTTQSEERSEQEELNEIKDICNDPDYVGYFTTLGSIPPEGFIQEMKALGYDDESHINMIWTICQEERLRSIDKYIGRNEGIWSLDRRGITPEGVVKLIEGAVQWLIGKNDKPYESERRIAMNLDRYFASDKDTYYLLMRIKDLELRVEALENAMDEIARDAYCQGKLDVMTKYNLSGVRCGETTYRNHFKDPSTGQNMVIGITPLDEEELEKQRLERIRLKSDISESESGIEVNDTEGSGSMNESVVLNGLNSYQEEVSVLKPEERVVDGKTEIASNSFPNINLLDIVFIVAVFLLFYFSSSLFL